MRYDYISVAFPVALSLVLGLGLGLAGCAAHTPAPAPLLTSAPKEGGPKQVAVGEGRTAKYYTAHFDHLQPEKAAQFERARREWLEVLTRHRTTDERGDFLQIDGAAFITLRGFESFAEL